MNTQSFYCLVLSVFTLFSFSTCKVQKGTSGNDAACNTSGKVQDFTGLDGCKLLIVLENGDKYLPTTPEFDGIKLEAGQELSFGYKEVEAMASICMAESKIIEFTCLQLKSAIPVKPECFNTDDPYSVKWMKEAMTTLKPESISKFTFRTDGWAYFFRGKTNYLYDCQGNLICDTKKNKSEDCLRFVEDRTKGTIIFQGEGVND